MEILRDPRALREALVEAHADLPRQAPQPQPVEAEHDQARDDGAGDPDRRHLPDPRGDLQVGDRLGTVPEARAVRRHHPEPVRPRAEVGVDRLARGDGLAPALVEAVEAVAEADAVRSGKAHTREGEGHPPRSRGNAAGRPRIPRRPVDGRRLEAGGERGGAAHRAQGVDHGNAGAGRDPDAAERIGHHRPVPFRGLGALEPVEGAELRDLDRSRRGLPQGRRRGRAAPAGRSRPTDCPAGPWPGRIPARATTAGGRPARGRDRPTRSRARRWSRSIPRPRSLRTRSSRRPRASRRPSGTSATARPRTRSSRSESRTRSSRRRRRRST